MRGIGRVGLYERNWVSEGYERDWETKDDMRGIGRVRVM